MSDVSTLEEILISPNAGPQSAYLASSADITAFGGAAGGGKALHTETPIATKDGWKTMRTLQVGDIIFAPDGSQTRITYCSPVGYNRTCFEVAFSDGSVIVADREHLWWTFTHREREQCVRRTDEFRTARRAKRPSRAKRPDTLRSQVVTARNAARVWSLKPRPEGGVRTTAEIAATLTARKTHNNHSVPIAKPLFCAQADLPIDPYILGLWLGDGHTNSGSITTADQEIFDALAAAGFEPRYGKARYYVGTRGLTQVLRRHGLIDNKHIPPIYLRASLEQRLALAQGLMDTDGYAAPDDGAVEFTTTSSALRDGALELLLTLGCKANACEGRATLNGRDCGPKYRILVCSDLPLFRLPRKLALQKRCDFRGTHSQRYIVAVTRCRSVPVRCIEVDHPSHCFLAGRALIPTHNSMGTLLRFGWHADKYPGYYGAIFRREMPMITTGGGVWEESMKLFPIWGARPNLSLHEWRFPRGRSLVQFRSIQHETDVLHYQSAQYAEFCLEEATQFSAGMFWYLISRLRSTCGMRPKACLTFNPDPDSWVRQLIDWYIGEDGFVIPTRAGKRRYFVRDGDELVWGDTPGEVRMRAPHVLARPGSFRFIPSMLEDNPRGDPTYAARLETLPLVERERLRKANWNIRHAAGTVFRREWFEVIDQAPGDVIATGRYWDLAATEPHATNRDPDWTRGVKMSRHRSGLVVIHDVVSMRARPAAVDQLVTATAQQDGRGCTQGFWQDPGQAGKSEVERYRVMLAGHVIKIVRAAENKLTYAKATSSLAEGGKVKLLRGPWNQAYLSEHEAFPDGTHDDIVDAESLGMLDLTAGVPTRALHIRGL